MTNVKASQLTTRRDIPSAKRLIEAAEAAATDAKERPSGVCRTPPDATTPNEGEQDDKEAADGSSG